MTHIVADRIRDTTTTTGTGVITVSGTAPATYKTFSARCSTNDTLQYFIAHQAADEWECGVATYSASNQLTRTTVYASSNADAVVSFSAGTKDVVLTQIAPKEIGFLWDPITKSLTLTGGTVTTSKPILESTQTWNNSGTVFNGIKMDVTDTASDTASLLMDLQISGTSKFSVVKDGSMNIGSPGGAGFTFKSDGTINAHNALAQFDNLGGATSILYVGALTLDYANADVNLRRDAAGILAQRNGANAQTFRVYNTFTNSSNYERGVFDWTTTANVLTIGTQALGTGTPRSIAFVAASGIYSWQWSGANDLWTLNASGTFAGVSNAGGIKFQHVIADGSIRVASDCVFAFNSGTSLGGGSLDTGISRSAAGVIALGNGTVGDGSATVLAKTKAGAFVAGDIPSGTWALCRDTSGATTKLIYNNAGTLMTVALT